MNSISVIDDLNSLDSSFDWSKEEVREYNRSSSFSPKEISKIENRCEKTLLMLMWNPKGETKRGYSEHRDSIHRALFNQYPIDLLLIQEPISKNPENYGKKVNSPDARADYDFVYPQSKKDVQEVAIAYNKSTLRHVRTERQYELVQLFTEKVNPNSTFPVQGPSRIQLSYFSVLGEDEEDYSEYHFHRKSQAAQVSEDLLVINIHSVYNNHTDYAKTRFITDFFRFVDWYLKEKKVTCRVLIGGDFNYNIDSLIEPLHKEYKIQLVLHSIPWMEECQNLKDIRVKENIDFILTLYSSVHEIGVVDINKLPFRYDYASQQFEEIKYVQEKNKTESSKVSTHDPILCQLLIYKSQSQTNTSFSDDLDKLTKNIKQITISK